MKDIWYRFTGSIKIQLGARLIASGGKDYSLMANQDALTAAVTATANALAKVQAAATRVAADLAPLDFTELNNNIAAISGAADAIDPPAPVDPPV